MLRFRFFLTPPAVVEITLINDGAIGIDIIKAEHAEWLAKDQVALLEHKNVGLSSARNVSLATIR